MMEVGMLWLLFLVIQHTVPEQTIPETTLVSFSLTTADHSLVPKSGCGVTRRWHDRRFLTVDGPDGLGNFMSCVPGSTSCSELGR